jgi:molybdopterin converting factor small subunit
VRVWIAEPLRSYTAQQRAVDAEGATVGELLADLDRRYPGIRFRMVDEQDQVRTHMRLFVNGAGVAHLATPLRDGDEVHVFQALSGG